MRAPLRNEMRPAPVPAQTSSIFVKTEGGGTFGVMLPLVATGPAGSSGGYVCGGTVGELKRRVEAVTGIPAGEQRFEGPGRLVLPALGHARSGNAGSSAGSTPPSPLLGSSPPLGVLGSVLYSPSSPAPFSPPRSPGGLGGGAESLLDQRRLADLGLRDGAVLRLVRDDTAELRGSSDAAAARRRSLEAARRAAASANANASASAAAHFSGGRFSLRARGGVGLSGGGGGGGGDDVYDDHDGSSHDGSSVARWPSSKSRLSSSWPPAAPSSGLFGPGSGLGFSGGGGGGGAQEPPLRVAMASAAGGRAWSVAWSAERERRTHVGRGFASSLEAVPSGHALAEVEAPGQPRRGGASGGLGGGGGSGGGLGSAPPASRIGLLSSSPPRSSGLSELLRNNPSKSCLAECLERGGDGGEAEREREAAAATVTPLAAAAAGATARAAAGTVPHAAGAAPGAGAAPLDLSPSSVLQFPPAVPALFPGGRSWPGAGPVAQPLSQPLSQPVSQPMSQPVSTPVGWPLSAPPDCATAGARADGDAPWGVPAAAAITAPRLAPHPAAASASSPAAGRAGAAAMGGSPLGASPLLASGLLLGSSPPSHFRTLAEARERLGDGDDDDMGGMFF